MNNTPANEAIPPPVSEPKVHMDEIDEIFEAIIDQTILQLDKAYGVDGYARKNPELMGKALDLKSALYSTHYIGACSE